MLLRLQQDDGQATGNAVACRYATIRRTANDSISRVMPLKNMLTPTSVPIAQTELIGQALPIIAASTSVTMPSNNNHPLPGSGRN
jgi:hypothetical protein